MRRWLLLGSACVALCAPAVATADAGYPVVLDTNRTLEVAPAVSARGAVFLEGRHFRLLGRDGRRHPLRQLDGLLPRDREDLTTALDASGRRVVLQFTRYECEDLSGSEVEPCWRDWSKFYVAALGGQPKLLRQCRDESEDTGGRQDIALRGSTLAYVACAHKGRTPIEIRSLSSPRTRARVIDPPKPDVRFVAVAMAGHFVAGLAEPPPDDDHPYRAQAGTAIVYDARTGAEVYRAPASAWSIDVDASGRLLVTRDDPAVTPYDPSCDGLALDWYSPAEPYAHPMTDRPCATGAKLTHGRAVFWRGGSDGRVTVVAERLTTGTVQQLTPSLDYPYRFDVAGTHMAYVAPACVDEQLVVEDLDGATESNLVPPERCPLRLAQPPVRVSSDGAVILRVRCPRACDAPYEIESHDGSEDVYDAGEFLARRGKLREVYATRVPRRRRKAMLLDLSITPYQPDGANRDVTRTIRIPPSKTWRSAQSR